MIRLWDVRTLPHDGESLNEPLTLTGHVGAIYQAGNWIYAGMTEPADEYIVGGVRIPFARAHGAYASVGNQDMLTETFRALVERTIPVRLDGGEMNEHIIAAGALDETIALRSVEPLYNAFFLHYTFS